jgi:hypothetical protein
MDTGILNISYTLGALQPYIILFLVCASAFKAAQAFDVLARVLKNRKP